MPRHSKLMVYAATSVYGGVYDDEFAEASAGFFEAVRPDDLLTVGGNSR